MGDRTVGHRHVQVKDVVDCLPVEDRPGAAGVVADHAADSRTAGSGDVGRESQPVRGELCVQLVEHDPRLDARPPLVDVHFEQPVEIF